MEQNIAILIADLSGYTALTETHGATTAADLIDKYVEIVNTCLVGDAHLHARVGDGVVIVSASADSLIATSIMLFQNTLEHNFLQVHGGLHYGKILKRNNDYFGTTINLAARIAAKADPGCIWCSSEYINALNDKSELTFLAKGKQSFKNINDEIDVHELVIENRKSYHIDPVCRMLIKETENAIPHSGDENLFFCSQHCFDVYVNKLKEE